MNSDSQLIKAALERRFARAGTPSCPEGMWRVGAFRSSPVARNIASPGHRFAYAVCFLAVVAVGSVAAQAAIAARESYERMMVPVFASTQPLTRLIHAADCLTMAQAQQRVPFTIVNPVGLPEHTRFMYAHVERDAPAARVALTYETHLGATYYRVSIEESTVVPGPPVAHFSVRGILGRTIDWTSPKLRWKHGSVTMDLFDWHLPSELNDRIVRANTL